MNNKYFHTFALMRTITGTSYIYRLIAEGEHQTQDFKFEISDVCKIARSLSAFANTNGGKLLVGVKDNGKITGIRSDEEIYMIEAAAKIYCIPEVQCQMQTYMVEGRTVLVAQVEANKQKPVYAKDENGKLWAYVRIHDENILATSVHLRVWKQTECPAGTLIKYTEREQLLLDLLEKEEYISINRFCRKARVSRREAENLLAQLIRFDIAEPVFVNHKFYFHLKRELTQ